MLENFSIANCKPRLILLSVGTSLLINDSSSNEKKVAEIEKIPYCEILGLLI